MTSLSRSAANVLETEDDFNHLSNSLSREGVKKIAGNRQRSETYDDREFNSGAVMETSTLVLVTVGRASGIDCPWIGEIIGLRKQKEFISVTYEKEKKDER